MKKHQLNNNENGVNTKKIAWKELLSQAQKKRADKNYVEAIDLCNQILANHSKKLSNSDKASVYYEMGRSNIAKEDYPKAFGDFNSAILLSPNASDIANYYNSRGVARGKIDTPDNTLQDYNRAIEFDEKNSVFYTNRAKVHYGEKNYTQALADYARAEQLDPSNQNISKWVKKIIDEINTQCRVFLTAVDEVGQKNKQQTLAFYDQVFQLMQHDIFAKDRVEVFYMRAVFYHNLGERKNALKDCELAIESAVKFGLEEDARFFYLKGLIVGGEASIIFHKKAIDLDPKNSTYHFILAQVYMNLSRYQLAVDSFSMAIQFSPHQNDLASYYSKRAEVYSLSGDKSKAIADYDMAINLDNKNSSIYSARGRLYADISNYSLALLDFKKAVRYSEKKFIHYNDIGNLFLDKGRRRSAFENFTKAISLIPAITTGQGKPPAVEDAWEFKSRGFIALYLKEFDVALNFYNIAIELRPNEAAYYLQRGIIFYKLNQFEKAITDFVKVLELEPDNELQKYRVRAVKFKQKAQTKISAALAFQNENPSIGYNAIQAKLATSSEEKVISITNQSDEKIKELEEVVVKLTIQLENEREGNKNQLQALQDQVAKLFSLIPKNDQSEKPQNTPPIL